MIKKNKISENFTLPSITIMMILFLWEITVAIYEIPKYVLPAPTEVLAAIWTEREQMLLHSFVTFQETILGIVLSVVFAIMVAILMDRFQKIKMAIYPILVVSQTIPIVVLAPILIIYMGFGMAPKILIVILMCFFPVVINFADGMARVDNSMVNLIKLMGGNIWQTYTLVKIPYALPELLSGLKVAATYSVMGAVVGEWLASSAGLGYYLLRLKNAYMLDKVFGCVIMIVILSLLMNSIVKILEKIFLKYEN